VLSGVFPLSEIPVLVRAGAVIPMRPIPSGGSGPTNGLAAQAYDLLELYIFPGAFTGGTIVYEDDGASTGYTKGDYAELYVLYNLDSAGKKFTFNASTVGSYSGQPSRRALTLRMVNAPPPCDVRLGKAALTFAAYGGAGTWTYDGLSATLVIEAGTTDINADVLIEVTFDDSVASMWQGGALAGLKGAIAHANLAKRALDEMRTTPGSNDINHGELDKLSVLGEQLADNAEDEKQWLQAARGGRGQLAAAIGELKAMSFKDDILTGPLRKHFAVKLLEESLSAMSGEVVAAFV
jgi:hypothetical protein